MRKVAKVLLVLLGVVLAIGAGLGIAALFYRDVPAREVDARWGQPPSQFIDIDGVRVHYRDEGSGPIVVLLHANYASLFMWTPWVRALEGRYRIVRLDLPAHGLTGPDPSGDYTLQRIQKIFEGFVAAKRLERFTIVGTSLGGTVAMRYAVDHPLNVERLVLISPGSLEPRVRGRTTPAAVPRVADVLGYVTPKSFTRYLLRNDFGDPTKLREATVDEWYAMWMREGNRLAMLALLRQYVSGGVEDKIRAVSVPVLLMWGEKNRRVPLALGYEFRDLLVNSPEVRLAVLPGVGHMAVQEAPEASAALIGGYLDGKPVGVKNVVAASR
jgi:pimeloyl-ACP methyl ester carboxylesterase